MDAVALQQQLNIVSTMTSAWTDPKIHLFINNHTVAPTDTFSSFVEPVASWYEPQAITYSESYVDITGSAAATAPAVGFYYGGSSASAVLVYGAFVTSPDGTLVSAYNFTNGPIPMGAAGNAVQAGSQLQFSPIPQGQWIQ